MKRFHIKLFTVVALLGLCATLVDAQTRKAGINSAAFLKVGVGARQVAMGSAVTSLGGDAANMFWNPAGISLTDQTGQVAFTHNNWIGGLTQEAVAASYNWEDVGTIGLGVMTFGVSGIPADRDYGYADPQLIALQIDQVGSSTYDYMDLLLQATFSRNIIENLSLGVTVKYINEKIDDQSANAFAFDIGSVYNIGPLGWSIGARLNNLGSDMKFYDFASPIPLTFAIGTSMTPVNVGMTSWTIAADLVKPQDGQQYAYMGTELGFNKMFFLRGGWKFNYSWFGLTGSAIDDGTTQRAPIQTSIERGSLGAGVRMPMEDYMVAVDYAYTVFVSVQDVHRFTLSIGLK